MSSDNAVLEDLARAYVAEAVRALGERVRGALLFDSVARGEANRRSDIDLLIVATGLAPSRLRRSRDIDFIDELLEPRLAPMRALGWHVEINALWRTPEEAARLTPLYFDLTEDAVLLLDRDQLLARTLAEMRRRMAMLGSKRERIGAAYVWRLKPDIVRGEDFAL